MPKSKYKKALNPSLTLPVAVDADLPGPATIHVYSDNNRLQFVSFQGGIFTYSYLSSQTKAGKCVTFTQEQLTRFLDRNDQIGRAVTNG